MGKDFKKEIKLSGCIDHNCGAKEVKSINRVSVDFKSRGRIHLVKKCIILMLLLTMTILGTLSFASTPIDRFSDINANHWALSFIDSLKSSNIVAGYPDGTFKPQANVKINEFIAMTVKALGFYYESPANDWAKPYIDKALELNIIEVGQFTNYNEPITRQSMTSVTVNAVVLSEERPSTEFDRFVANEIKDFSTVCDYCKQNVLDAYKLGITTGYSDKTFKPSLSSTRAEATTMISKIIKPELRDVPKYDFKAPIKHWYWVKGSDGGDWWWDQQVYYDISTQEKFQAVLNKLHSIMPAPGKVIAGTGVFYHAEFELVDDYFYMPVYKGKNLKEMYELGKYMNTVTTEAGESPLYIFGNGFDGFTIDAFESKSAYTTIFEQNFVMHDQLIYKIQKNELIIGASAYLYPEYAYMISLDKKDYEKHRDLIEKMIKFQFKQDANFVLNKIDWAMSTNEQELITFGINGRNVQINNTSNHIKIEYSVKYN